MVLSFIPACGRCEPCTRGMSNLCVLGCGHHRRAAARRHLPVPRPRPGPGPDVCAGNVFGVHRGPDGVGGQGRPGSIALDTAALVGCGVTTGYGSVVRTGETRDGDTVVVMGVGGIGINAIQGARIAGARVIVALDPVEYKRTPVTGVRRHPHRGDSSRRPRHWWPT